jgi:predicted transcriptional regulator
MKRKPLEIKKEILKILNSEQKLSIKKLEKKVNTNYQTIINNCKELEYFGFLKIKKTKEKSLNGREYLIAELIKNK